ncbi:MAG: type II secretion system GspH family protein [Kiritimatiellae bacterium]|nr:type II secretion system GspH family protein [Kiritimatiellia bacterium]
MNSQTDAGGGARTRCSSAFTLIELLVVISIIAILAALVFPMLNRAQKAADFRRAEIEVQALHSALKAYLEEYSKWPVPNALEGDVSVQMVKVLTAHPDERERNPRGRVFLKISGIATNSAGAMVDPWGNPYRFALDSDMNLSISDAHDPDGVYKALPGQNVAVWSRGPNGKSDPKNSASYDDITSW